MCMYVCVCVLIYNLQTLLISFFLSFFSLIQFKQERKELSYKNAIQQVNLYKVEHFTSFFLSFFTLV